MKVTLISPPLFNPIEPYLAVPSLKAFLEQCGHKVIQIDANVEFFNTVLCSAYLSDCYKVIRNKYNELRENKCVTEDDMRRYVILKKTLSCAPYIIKKVDLATKFLKINHSNRPFLSPLLLELKLLWNYMILSSGLNIASLSYYPTTFTFDSLKMGYSIASSSDLLKAVEDRSQNLFIDFFEKYILPGILINKPGLVGISINNNEQIIPGLTFSKLLKDRGIYVTIGGVIFTKELKIDEELFNLCDSFVINEGEHASLELIKQLENAKDFYSVPNLIWRNEQSKQLISNSLNYVEDLDSLPTPNFEGIANDRYFKFFRSELRFPLAVSKGCYWNKCAFCGIIKNNEYRARKTAYIIDDILKIIINYGVESFVFTSESLSPALLEELSKAIIENKLNIKWKGYARFEEEFTEIFCQSLAMSGCEELFLGLESGSQRILDFMEKGTNLENVRMILNNLHKVGIAVHLFVLVGFPTETIEEAQETLNFILDNRMWLDRPNFTFEINRVYYYHISKLFRYPEKYNIEKIKIKNTDDDLETRTKYSFLTSSDISYDMVEKLSKQWYYLVHERFHYYGLKYIFSKDPISENIFLRFVLLFIKFIRHSINYKISNFS